MIHHLVLILALVLWQITPIAAMAAPCSPTPQAMPCCGSECCCPPAMCACAAPDSDPTPAAPAAPASDSSSRALNLALAMPLIGIIDAHGEAAVNAWLVADDHRIRGSAGHERQSLLCKWMT